MKINLTLQRRDDVLVVEKSGDRIRINGELFNFNSVPDGGYVKHSDIPCEWIIGDVKRVDGEIELTLILPHGANPEKLEVDPIIVTKDGVVKLPVIGEVNVDS